MKLNFSGDEELKNEHLKKQIQPNCELQNLIVDYVGRKNNPDDDNVTVEMIVDVFAQEFPEFLMVVAEENFIRGYQQGIDDSRSFDVDEPECGNPFISKRPGSE